MAKTGTFLNETENRYEFWLVGIRVGHIAREQYEALSAEQQAELHGLVWAEVFREAGLLTEDLVLKDG